MPCSLQAVLLPFLVDIDRVGPEGAEALRRSVTCPSPLYNCHSKCFLQLIGQEMLHVQQP
jgi:hypothetical protein